MSKNQTFDKKLPLFTAGLVLLLAVCLSINVLSWQPDEGHSVSTATRQPASTESIDSTVSDGTNSSTSPQVFDFQCLKSGTKTHFLTHAHQLRLTGQLCPTPPPAKLTKNNHHAKKTIAQVRLASTQIINRSNGYVATTFNVDHNRFTSDYIYLAPGTNDIWISLKDADGQKLLTEMIVQRN